MPPRKPMEPDTLKAPPRLFKGNPQEYAEVVRQVDEDRKKEQGKK